MLYSVCIVYGSILPHTGAALNKRNQEDHQSPPCEAPWPSAITGDVRSSTRHRIRHGEGDDPDPQFSVSEFKTEMITVLHDSTDSAYSAGLRRTRRSHSTCYARVTQYVIAIHKTEYTFYTTNILTFLTCIFPKHKPERRSIGLQSHSQQHNLPKPLLTICHENNYF